MAGEWHIETAEPRDRIDRFLKTHEPWRMLVTFSNGSRTDTFKTFKPFNARPLNKLALIEKVLPLEAFKGRALDVGFNVGYNTIALVSRYGMEAVGIDVVPRHKTVAERLASMLACSSKATFLLQSAEEVDMQDYFDLVLHLGTIYHLPNPVQSLKNTIASLRKGGWFALEGEAYIGPGSEDCVCRFIYGMGGDKTNWWALSKATYLALFEMFGLGSIKQIGEFDVGTANQRRVMYVAQKL